MDGLHPFQRSSGKTYRVALRGWKRGDSYCTCPDFRKNTLGTCKHILYALGEVKKRFSKDRERNPLPRSGPVRSSALR